MAHVASVETQREFVAHLGGTPGVCGAPADAYGVPSRRWLNLVVARPDPERVFGLLRGLKMVL